MDMNMGGDSSSAGTQSTVTANLVIGAAESDDYVQTQKPIKVKTGEVENTLYSNKNHIAGDNYPMYGKASVKGDENPRIKMKHLSALVALKIVNQGDGVADNGNSSIKINNVEFVAPEEVVGNFNVTVSQTPIKYAKVAASATAKVNLANANGDGITIKPRDEALVYFAVKPFTAKKDAKITIKINGSPRTVPMPKEINFEAGKVTTLRVPVKLDHHKKSEATSGKPFEVTMPVKTTKIYVNGEEIEAYIIPNGESLRIKGTVRNLLNAFDAGFYASCWQGKQAAMTVSNINLWMPEYNSDGSFKKHTQIGSYEPLLNEMKKIIVPIIASALNVSQSVAGFIWSPGLFGLNVKNAFSLILMNGVPRDGELITLTRFIDPTTITFSGILENGAIDTSQDIIIMDENPIFKEVGVFQVNNLLKEKFVFNGYTPIFDELKEAAMSGTSNQSIATIYAKIQNKVGEEEFYLDGIGNVAIWPIVSSLFPDHQSLAKILGDLQVSVDIATCTYPNSKDPNANTYPVIFWGINSNL